MTLRCRSLKPPCSADEAGFDDLVGTVLNEGQFRRYDSQVSLLKATMQCQKTGGSP